jgi:hypothetical protein
VQGTQAISLVRPDKCRRLTEIVRSPLEHAVDPERSINELRYGPAESGRSDRLTAVDAGSVGHTGKTGARKVLILLSVFG